MDAACKILVNVQRLFAVQEYAELRRLRALERRAYRMTDLPAEIADAIEGTKMSPTHDQLNDLLKESKPSEADQLRASLKTTG